MEVDIQDGQVILREVKLTLVMSKEEFMKCLQRGKTYRRQQQMAQRLKASAPTITQ